MLVEGIRALIDLAHWEEFGTGELGIDEQIISAAKAAGEANVVDSRQQRVSRRTIRVHDAAASHSQSLKKVMSAVVRTESVCYSADADQPKHVLPNSLSSILRI